jgi:uncharacterized membrane protein
VSSQGEGATQQQDASAPSTAEVLPLIQQRCGGCHSESPTLLGFTSPVMGLALDTADQLESQAPGVFQTTVITRTMPFGNMTEMTEEERDSIARWYAGRVKNQ